VPSDRPEALAKAILEILTDKAKARQMGEVGRKKFEKEFTLDVMVKKYEDLYAPIQSFLLTPIQSFFPTGQAGQARERREHREYDGLESVQNVSR
jgi:hypothetical protein